MDPTRGLTKIGEEQIPIMADFLDSQHSDIGLIVHSDMRRGRDTAEGIAKLLKIDNVVQTPFVGPETEVPVAWAEIQRLAKTVDDDQIMLVVSHGPLINALSAYLLESGEGDKFHFSHGTIVKFDTEVSETYGPYDGHTAPAWLHWMVTCKVAKRAMKHDPELIEAQINLASATLEALGLHLDEAQGEYYYDTENVKRWVLGSGGKSGNCDVCEENAERGWIGDDETFLGVDGDIDEPPAHPGCDESGCSVEYKEKRVRVYV